MVDRLNEEKAHIHKIRWFIFVAVVLQTFINCVDASSINVALPSMADELGVTMAGIEWVVTANTLMIICLILLFGKLGDTIGKDTIFKAGILIFIAGSGVCFLSRSFPMLIAGRLLEGIGSAATMANNQGIIVQTFPLHERGKALGLNGTFVALGSMVGPSIGGLIVAFFNWNMIFLMNIPLALVCFAMCCKYLPDMSSERQEKTDFSGLLLFIVMILCVYSGVKLLQSGADYYLYCLLILVVAIVFGYGFVTWERRCRNAMVDVSMFDNRLFAVSVFCAFLSFFTIAGHNFIQPFYLQKVQMLNAAQTGLLMMAYSVTMGIVAPFSGQLSDKIGSEFLCFIGLCINTVALLILSTLGVNSSLVVFILGSITLATGMAMFQSPNTSLIMSTVSRHQTGVAGSINALSRNLGMVFGISFSTVILYNIMSGQLGYTVMSYIEGEEQVFVVAMHWCYRFMAMVCAIGAALTGRRWRQSKQREE